MKISLVILTLNEITGLKALLHKIPRDAVDEILAIDGGSCDGTCEFLKKNNILTYKQSIRGRGDAFRLAFQKANGEALIFFGPDGNEDPGDIPKFRKYLEGGNDMVMATRMSRGGHNEEDENLFKWRKWANNAFTLMANVTWNFKGPYITDTINGFRAIRRDAWNKLNLDGQGYTIEYQSSIRAFKNKLKIKEFPTYEGKRIDESNNAGSPSISTGLAFIKLYIKELFFS